MNEIIVRFDKMMGGNKKMEKREMQARYTCLGVGVGVGVGVGARKMEKREMQARCHPAAPPAAPPTQLPSISHPILEEP